MDEPDYIQAHKHSSRHRQEIINSDLCGCFCCLEIFPPEDIVEWVDEHHGVGQTALCPHCGIDSVLGSASGYPIDREFLEKMNEYWC